MNKTTFTLLSALLPLSSGIVLAQAPTSSPTNPTRTAVTATPNTPTATPAPTPVPVPEAVVHSTLPIRQVTLYTSGVAYTERQGMVNGDASVPLLFRTAQINDILKSLVLIDQRGQVRPATYASRDPVGHALQAFAVDVTQNLTQEEILGRMRGAQVSVETPGKAAVVGQIYGVQERQVAGEDNKPISVSYLNLLTDAGITSIRLDGEKTVRILDERLNKEFHEALSVLASGSDDQRRQVMLHFAGNGSREVHVGYVMESPIWKISYRLVMGEGAEKAGVKSYLQGWALVENTTDEDWENVRLSLVSGRPVSFIQDLYQPLYIPRPVVGPDVVASPYPQTHDENMLAEADKRVADNDVAYGPGGVGGHMPIGRRPSTSTGGGRVGGFQGSPGPAGQAGGGFGGLAGREDTPEGEASFRRLQAEASGQKAGELFQYKIDIPVTLPRQQAAMIPVIAQDIETEKVSLYNANLDGKFPMNAIRIHNTTTLHLKGGPVSLFDGGAYAGDARMEDVPPGDARLISYAVDLSMECERQNSASNVVETTFSIKRGVLTIKRQERDETTYVVKSKADKPRVLLIEHPFDPQHQLLTPEKPTERTSSVYRFAVTVAPGKSQTLRVVTECPLVETIAILDGNMDTLVAYSNRKDLDAKLHTALSEVIQRRHHVEELRASSNARRDDVKSISDDQERIRKNMAALDRSSALYKRYVSELDTQETKIENLRQEAIRLENQAATADQELRAYVDSLNL